MAADEYLGLIDDPTGFFLYSYFHRVFGGLATLEKMPLLPPVHEIPMIPSGLIPFGMPDVKEAMTKLSEAGDEVHGWLGSVRSVPGLTDYWRNLIDVAGKDCGFILCSGVPLQGGKAENLKAMIDFSKSYSVCR